LRPPSVNGRNTADQQRVVTTPLAPGDDCPRIKQAYARRPGPPDPHFQIP
jgi:hypothetical protein